MWNLIVSFGVNFIVNVLLLFEVYLCSLNREWFIRVIVCSICVYIYVYGFLLEFFER